MGSARSLKTSNRTMPGSSRLARAFRSVAAKKASSCSGTTAMSTWTTSRLFGTSRPYYLRAARSQPEMTQVRRDFLSGRGTVRRLEASQECVAEAILLGPDYLDRIARQK